ncbi:MAG: Rpn family recombination-promoting nuclease/putative transposase [Lachnospiraceae bacterium]|nr:Rpn family recombination-promoting nuclease/putative transposase [Lachnospiraceae bacterium]
MSIRFQDLSLNNSFLFAVALEDPETCKLIVQLIIGKKLREMKVRAEHSILFSSDFRSVRLDVYAEDDAEVSYNLEMQNTDEKNLAKRSRFYQAEMDVTSLKPGEDFSKLKPCYIIFICTFDPFGKGLYRYVFEPYCKDAEL